MLGYISFVSWNHVYHYKTDEELLVTVMLLVSLVLPNPGTPSWVSYIGFFFFYGGFLMDVASQTAWRNSHLLSACLPASTVENPIHSPMSCVHLLLGLPLPLLPSHVPSKNSFSNVLCCLMWPKYDRIRLHKRPKPSDRSLYWVIVGWTLSAAL